MTITRCLIALCLSVAQAGSGAAGDATPAFRQKDAATGWAVRETSLGPAGDMLAVSPDRRHVARVVRRGDKEVVLRDRTESPEYESVRGVGSPNDPYFMKPPLLFSPDSRRLAYVAKRNGNWRLVIDGDERAAVKVGGSISSGNQWGTSVFLAFTTNGDRWFAWADGGVLYADGGVLYDSQERPLDAFPTCISQDGGSFAFIRWSVGRRRELIVHGPQGIESRRDVGPPKPAKFVYDCAFGYVGEGCEFSPDGKRLAYTVVLRAVHAVEMLFGRDTSCRLLMDEGTIAEGQQLKWPVFSSESTRFVFAVKRSGKWYVVVNGREEGAYDDIDDGRNAFGRKRQLFFSPDGKRLGYSAKKDGQWFAVVDGRSGESFAKVGPPVFSLDSSRVAYRAKRQGKWLVVVDGKPGKPYDEIEKEALSDRGWLRDEVTFSSNGTRIAYRAKSGGKWFAVVDGQEGPAYDEVAPLVFSPGGQHFAYAARRKDKWVFVADGIEGGEYDFLTDRRIVFDGPRQMHTVIQRGGEHLLLEVEIPAS